MNRREFILTNIIAGIGKVLNLKLSTEKSFEDEVEEATKLCKHLSDQVHKTGFNAFEFDKFMKENAILLNPGDIGTPYWNPLEPTEILHLKENKQ